MGQDHLPELRNVLRTLSCIHERTFYLSCSETGIENMAIKNTGILITMQVGNTHLEGPRVVAVAGDIILAASQDTAIE